MLEQYRLMLLIRCFEERAAELFKEGMIFGTAHSCVGQEAIAVGAAGVMFETDYVSGTTARMAICWRRGPILAA